MAEPIFTLLTPENFIKYKQIFTTRDKNYYCGHFTDEEA